MPDNKIVLAYSGGLDTSVAVPWLKEKFGAEIVTLTVDLGMVDLEAIRLRALRVGASKALVVDGKESLVREFLYPALQAGAVYEDQYPLATALGRPLIARCLVEAARSEGAYAVAHGCTGKGNDQVRIEVSVAALAPGLRVIAPIRDWGMSRQEEIEYAKARALPIHPSTSRFSVDENLWGRSVEAGELENPWLQPPEEAYAWTKPLSATPEEPAYLEIHFEQGIPTAIDGEEMAGTDLISYLNALSGSHGVGRIDHVENRLVGIKSREVYEAPAALVLHNAHRALEAMTLSKEQARTKARLAQEYADAVYNGLWFTLHRQDLDAYFRSTQRYVTGDVRIRLHKGTCTVVGRKSAHSLYQHRLATYDATDTFDRSAAGGFISIYGLPVRTQNQIQSPQRAAGTAWRIRPAQPTDLSAIDALLVSANGDREELREDQFVVAEDREGAIVGCGRLKPYPAFCELASLAVAEGMGAQGVGRGIVTSLLERYKGAIYLLCEDDVVSFFRRFGFVALEPVGIPEVLAPKWRRYAAQVVRLYLMRRG